MRQLLRQSRFTTTLKIKDERRLPHGRRKRARSPLAALFATRPSASARGSARQECLLTPALQRRAFRSVPIPARRSMGVLPILNGERGSTSGRLVGPGVTTTFQDLTTGKYYDASGGYNSNSTINWGGSASPLFGFSISSSTPPPASAHNAGHSYRWCVFTRDFFYQSNIACAGFTGIP